jgi:hypothetical protein
MFFTVVENFIRIKLVDIEHLAFFIGLPGIKKFKDMPPNHNFVLWQIQTLENQSRIRSNH